MQLIRCTKKLQKEMGLKKGDLCKEVPKFSYLGQWHANLLYIDRKKCVLFVNDKTLFNFIAPAAQRSEIKNLSRLFKDYFRCVLSYEEFDKTVKNKMISEFEDVEYSSSSDNSVLGSMNDLAFHYKWNILDAGGINSAAVPEIIRRLNRMPMGALKYDHSIDRLRGLYETTI
jgi:hypothetical protein